MISRYFCLIFWIIVALIICLAIGLPTFLVGCNSEYYKYGCVGYEQVNGVVDNSYTQETICRRCYKSGNSQFCSSYTCYGAYVDWNVCTERLGTWSDEADAKATANKYYRGLQMTVWVEKSGAKKCTSNFGEVSTGLPITGIVFLSISGAIALTLIIVLIVGSLSKQPRLITTLQP